MKILPILSVLALVFAVFFACKKDESIDPNLPKVFVANEEDGTLSVLDAANEKYLATIKLALSANEPLLCHNVQVAPDGKSVWVTALPGGHHGEEQLIVIDPQTFRIVKRIPMGEGLHMAHVVLDEASKYAFVTAKESNRVIQLDAATFQVVKTFDLGTGEGPHGIRCSNGKLFVAHLGGQKISVINIADGQITEIPANGKVVQTAVTPDGKFVFGSVYDTKEILRYDLENGQSSLIALPSDAQGPLQMYPSPDSKWLLVCDQGMLDGRPASNKVYFIDIAAAAVVHTLEVGNAAHGVVVDNHGEKAFVTNTLGNSVSIIDLSSRSILSTISVGKSPNGISYWFPTGGMP
ncbi:MAG: YncE family protein [Saprospiraceae bacterium]